MTVWLNNLKKECVHQEPRILESPWTLPATPAEITKCQSLLPGSIRISWAVTAPLNLGCLLILDWLDLSLPLNQAEMKDRGLHSLSLFPFSVLVCSSCHNKTLVNWVAWTTEINFLIVLETGSPRSGRQHGEILLKVSSWLSNSHFLLFSHIVERKRERKLAGVSYKDNNHIMGLHHHDLIKT